MKFARYELNGRTALGLVEKEHVLELPAVAGEKGLSAWLPPDGRAAARAHREHAGANCSAISQVSWLPPLSPRSRIFAVGINYRSHATETGRDLPPYPSVFIRTQESIIGHRRHC